MAQNEDGLFIKLESKCMEWKDKITLVKSYLDADDDEGTSEEIKVQTPMRLDFSGQILLKEHHLNDLEGLIILPRGEQKATFIQTLVENPTPEILVKA